MIQGNDSEDWPLYAIGDLIELYTKCILNVTVCILPLI